MILGHHKSKVGGRTEERQFALTPSALKCQLLMFLAKINVGIATHFSTHKSHLLGDAEASDGDLLIRVAFQMEDYCIVAADE